MTIGSFIDSYLKLERIKHWLYKQDPQEVQNKGDDIAVGWAGRLLCTPAGFYLNIIEVWNQVIQCLNDIESEVSQRCIELAVWYLMVMEAGDQLLQCLSNPE